MLAEESSRSDSRSLWGAQRFRLAPDAAFWSMELCCDWQIRSESYEFGDIYRRVPDGQPAGYVEPEPHAKCATADAFENSDRGGSVRPPGGALAGSDRNSEQPRGIPNRVLGSGLKRIPGLRATAAGALLRFGGQLGLRTIERFRGRRVRQSQR